MKKTLSFLALILLHLQTLHAQDTAGKYIFFLHNRFTEMFDLDQAHPDYGKCEYREMVEKFRQGGFTVISEKRPTNTEAGSYARKVVKQIDSLLGKGVVPGDITVIGTSKGGYIAQYVSTYLKNPQVNFVFIGCYQDTDLQAMPEIQFCGHILTIYEETDPLGVSAVKRKEASKLSIPRFCEIELHTQRQHGFLYHPMDEWMQPAMLWAKGQYEEVCRKKNENDTLVPPGEPEIRYERPSNTVNSADPVYEVTEEKPVFPPAENDWKTYFKKNLVYPAAEKKEGIGGKVYVKFTVMRDGSVQDIVLLRGLSPGLDQEALRLVKAMKGWTPGKINGQPVNSRFVLPVIFAVE